MNVYLWLWKQAAACDSCQIKPSAVKIIMQSQGDVLSNASDREMYEVFIGTCMFERLRWSRLQVSVPRWAVFYSKPVKPLPTSIS